MKLVDMKEDFVVFKIGKLYIESLIGLTLTSDYKKAFRTNLRSIKFLRQYDMFKSFVEENDLGEFKVVKVSKRISVEEIDVLDNEIEDAKKIASIEKDRIELDLHGRVSYTDVSER
ncbi:hypothetical protein [Bacillus phage vB_BanS-Thrax1]|nr:hypothetical protein [Bacillus phage vB_BanS-Thrax1]